MAMANIELPKDAEGREIPLDTKIMSCWNVYDDTAYGSCDNGFKCSVCGCKVEDEEHYRVSGVWNFCPGCGRRVVKP